MCEAPRHIMVELDCPPRELEVVTIDGSIALGTAPPDTGSTEAASGIRCFRSVLRSDYGVM